MRNFTDSDYALNRYSENIVYKFLDGIVEITKNVFLFENPDKTEDDFTFIKIVSDAIYHEQDRSGYRQTWKNTSFYDLDDLAFFAVSSPEDYIVECETNNFNSIFRRKIAKEIMKEMTKTQRRRYILHHVNGKTTREIAFKEGVSQAAVVYSLEQAQRKINKFLNHQKKDLSND